MTDMSAHQYGKRPAKKSIQQKYDVCIIGSGASGAIAAYELVHQGLSVLMLERGPYIHTGTTYDDIISEAPSALVRTEVGTWAPNGYPWSTSNIGGGTVFYGGVSYRYRPVDFAPTAYLPHADLPLTWPYDYDVLAPYYTEVETLLGIAGDPCKDPLNPPLHTNLPLPPHPYSDEAECIAAGAERLSLTPFPTPLAILSQPYKDRSPCNKSSFCIGDQCPETAKGDAYRVFLAPLLKKENFRLFAGIEVLQLIQTQKNCIASAQARDVLSGMDYHFEAKAFVLACNAVQSAALLLRSANTYAPKGIANDTDMVGRGFCQKLSRYVVGYLPCQSRSSPPEKTKNTGPFSTVSITDYYLHSDFPNQLGGLIYEAKYGHLYTNSPDYKILRLECILADTPMRTNRVMLRNGRTALDYTSHPLDILRLTQLTNKAKEILQAAGCAHVHTEESGFALGSSHFHGTCRFSNHPKDGVLTSAGQPHGIDNLWVIDGSFMPYPGGVNPTHTIQAHALKIARESIGRNVG